MVANSSVSAWDLSGAENVPRFPPGRRCEERGCRTILSSYNPGNRCWAHREVTPVLSVGLRRTRDPEGPKVLNDGEERALVQALTSHRGTIRRRRDSVPGPEPVPAPSVAGPEPVPAPQPVPSA
jgi:hypothetical protein